MQCQGTTRSGARCRNSSLSGELFCDVHMRVNKSRNLTLIIPGLLTLIGCYFVLFSLYLSNATYAVFNIPYLQFAGLDDVFLNAVKFAAVICFAVTAIWLLYSAALIVFCCIALILSIIKSTHREDATFLEILKAILLGLYVLIANIGLRLLSIIPGTGRIRGTKVEIKQNRFSRAYLELRDKDGAHRTGRPFLNAKEILQRYLFLRNMGNHRFAIFTALLVALTFGVYFTALTEAARIKTCKSEGLELLSAGNYPPSAYQLLNECTSLAGEKNFAYRGFARLSRHLFPHSVVLLNLNPTPAPLLHLGSTSRFDLLFDAHAKKPVILPKGIHFSSPHTSVIDVAPLVEKIQEGFKKLSAYGFWQKEKLESHNQRLNHLDNELNRIEKLIFNSDRKSRSQASLALVKENPLCTARGPDLVVAYELNQTGIRNPVSLDKIRKFGLEYRRKNEFSLMISGYADPSGSDTLNFNISKARAEVIGHLLHQTGIPLARLKIVAMGKNASTQLPRRRVEIRVCPNP